MQAIEGSVTVFVATHALRTGCGGGKAATLALQYVAVNSGFDVVKFSADFSKSTNIKLDFPTGKGCQAGKPAEEVKNTMVIDCELYPFERRVLAYVKKGKKRAFVRVHYVVISVITPSLDEVIKAQELAATGIQQQLQISNHTFNHIRKWKPIPCRPATEVDQACAEINRYYREYGHVFVDASFPPTTESLYNPAAGICLPEGDVSVYTLCKWEHLHNTADASWTFTSTSKMHSEDHVSQEDILPTSFSSGLPSQDSFLCAISILVPYVDRWLPRWFPLLNDTSPPVEDVSAIPVALCDRGLVWERIIVDLFFPTFPLGQGLMTLRNVHGEWYAMLLHKAYAKMKGSYAAIANIPTMSILRELTGSPWVCLFRGSGGEDNLMQSEKLVQLEYAIQNIVSHCRRRGKSMSTEEDAKSGLVIATLGKVDNHRRAFRLTIPSSENCLSALVILQDASGKYLLDKVPEKKADPDQDPTEPRIPWEQLFALEPTIWSLSINQRHERRLRRTFLHQKDVVKMTMVISVSTLSTIALSSFCSDHFAANLRGATQGNQKPLVDLDMSIHRVDNDFSLVPLASNNEDGSAISSASSHRSTNSDGRVFNKQVVKALSAGEYVVAISATCLRPDEEPSTGLCMEQEEIERRKRLTPDTVDANLQVLFDCLDREGKHALSEGDLDEFLRLFENMTLSQLGQQVLHEFVQQHGSSTRPGSDERRLTFDDFREIYLALAVQDYGNKSQENSHVVSDENATRSSWGRARFQELVWCDLVSLLSNSTDESRDGNNSRAAIDSREIMELVCCIQSDTPLLDIVVLPNRDNSLEVKEISK